MGGESKICVWIYGCINPRFYKTVEIVSELYEEVFILKLYKRTARLLRIMSFTYVLSMKGAQLPYYQTTYINKLGLTTCSIFSSLVVQSCKIISFHRL